MGIRKEARIIIGAVFSLAWSFPVAAYFADMGGGVRPTGLGEAFVAVADDFNAMQYNPAGLSGQGKVEVSGMYSSLYSGLDLRLYNQAHDYFGYNLLSLATLLPEVGGGVGLTWKQFSTDFYQENILQLGYGRKVLLWGAEPQTGGVVALGCNLKWLQWQLQSNQYTSDPDYYPYSELQKSAFSADAGVLLTWHEDWKMGFSVENAVPANVGLVAAENVPAVYRLGAAYQIHFASQIADSFLVTTEISERNQELTPRAGLESWHFHDRVALRMGANQDNLACGMSLKYAWDAAALAFQLDYAYTYPWHLADTAGSHWVGMTIGWDWLNPRELEKKQEMERRVKSALHARTIAQGAVQTAHQTYEQAQTAAGQDTQEGFTTVKIAEVKIEDLLETVNLARGIIETAATEAKSDTLTALVEEMSRLNGEITVVAQQSQALLKETELRQVASQVTAPVEAQNTLIQAPLPEKNTDRIVLGIETKVITDFGSQQDLEPMLQTLAVSLGKAVGMKLEVRLLSPAEMQLALHQNELDGVLAYETELGKYSDRERLQAVLTVQRHGQTWQPCCLVVREDSPITTLAQAKGKRLGYSNSVIAAHLGSLFLKKENSSDRFFGSMEKEKNARDSLWSLQMNGVDVVAEYAYILDIVRSISGMNLRVIAESSPEPNAPLWLRTSSVPAKNAALQKLVPVLRQIKTLPAARPLLEIFQVEQVVPVNAEH